MKLGKLIKGVTVEDFHGNPEMDIKGLTYDSRLVKHGYMFVAMRGQSLDGHRFIGEAVKNGAVAVVSESKNPVNGMSTDVATVRVPDSHAGLSTLAVNFYGRPFEHMSLIGITGTNGKTTTSYVLESILLTAGATPGIIGTINYRRPGKTWPAPVTTPESSDLMCTLREMADAGVTDVIMEVSSHALDQGRTRDCPFGIAVFTNISRDHLDYHGTMERYFEAKSLLFRTLKREGDGKRWRAVINADDPKGKALMTLTEAPVLSYGLDRDCNVTAKGIKATERGLTGTLVTPVGEVDMTCCLIGHYNVYNIMAASAAAVCMEIDPDTISAGIARLKGVPGRLELVKNKKSLTIAVDYAHTPDALLKTLEAVRPLTAGRLITIFGCGGDRDRGKREEMGRMAGERSDLVFITSDNPRTEDPSRIASQIESGVRKAGLRKLTGFFGKEIVTPGYVVCLDRARAVRRAVEIAHKEDFILIAGKGHEAYQITGNMKRPFDDRAVAAEAAAEDR